MKARYVLTASVLCVRNCLVCQKNASTELIVGQACMHLSLITLHSARDDPSGGRCRAQIPQLDTPQASKESHNSMHNRRLHTWLLITMNTVILLELTLYCMQ